MTVSTFLSAVADAMKSALSPDFEVCAADDDFSALEILSAGAPGRTRLVITCGDLSPVEGGDGAGMVCTLTTRMMVQVERGLSENATDEARHRLLDAEEAVRRYALSLLFHEEGTDPPDFAALAAGATPHPTAGQLVHAGSAKYDGPYEDVVLEHPAREIRFTSLIGLCSPEQAIPVPLPL